MCQGCVDRGELSQETFDKISAFLGVWPNAEFGPAHIVLGDDNIEDENIQWCLDNWETYKRDHPEDELNATRVFLHELLQIPEAIR